MSDSNEFPDSPDDSLRPQAGQSQAPNPFAVAPSDYGRGVEVPPDVDPVFYQGRGAVRQVRPIAIGLMIHGALLLVMGACVGFAAVAFFTIPEIRMDDDPTFQAIRAPMAWGFVIAAAVVLSIGFLQFIAGVLNYTFRARVLGIVALSLGIVTALTVYCAPTGIALAIWGLINYLNPAVRSAFAMVESGESANDVLELARR